MGKRQAQGALNSASATREPAPAEPAFPPAARRALVILTVIACGVVLWAAQDFLMPTAAAVVLALILAPIVKTLERFGLPTAAASSLVVVSAGAILIGGAFVVAPQISDLVDRSPEIARTIERKTRPVKEWLHSMQTATATLTQATSLGAETPPAAGPAETGNGILDVAPVVMAQTVYVLVLALFLIATRRSYRNRIILLPADRDNRLRVARILNETLTHVSSYLFVISAINVGVGLTTAVVFALIGVPHAIVWGIAFGLACFIPYLGPISAILLCGLVQLISTDTVLEALVPPLILLVINGIESNLITPWLVSRRLAVSALAVFFTVALFAWLWGPLASIVAVPVLILFGAVARHVPQLKPWAVLLMAEHQSTFETRDNKRRFFAAEGALHAPEKG
jgi:predicted PurR-regulated permease PerM